MTNDEMPVADLRVHQVVVDCSDPRTLSAFWRRITGFEAGSTLDDWCSIRSADGRTRIGFQQVPEVKTVKNRAAPRPELGRRGGGGDRARGGGRHPAAG